MAASPPPSDSTGLGRIMSKQAFEPENFVNKLSQGGEEDLEEMRKKVQTLADDTAVALKKNVYKNYSQFIETAKEISILEGEMYQLSHMLTDQKSVLSAMMELSITGNKIETPDEPELPHPKEEAPEKNLARLLEKVEGCSSVTEVPGRHLIFDGDLAELDPESFTTIGKIHIFLLNDSLMIATWLPHRRGPVKYKFQSLYELDSLAIVNARDVGPCKNAFKILMFPDTRMFQADNPKTKRQWLDVLEETKKKKAALDSQRKEAAAAAAAETRTASTRSGSVRTSARMSTTSSSSFDSLNPFSDEFEDESAESRPMSAVLESDLLHEDWLLELPEDLDVCIAQRNFEGAVDLIDKVNEYMEELPRSAAVREYKARIDSRVKQLTDVLVNELQASPERSLRGGPRAARRAVTQLIRLGKSAQACTLFLNHRSAIIKHSLLQLKLEGATTLYIKKLCEVFFTGLMETGQEFIKAFPNNYGCFSAFVIWAKNELQSFVKTFTSQVFVTKATLTMVAECVSEARKRCDQLSSIGLELTFVLDTLILPDLEKILKDAAELQVEAIRHRASEDNWRPVNFMNLETTERFEEEMMDFGLRSIRDYTYDDCFTALSTTTIQFTRSYLTFCNDCMKVYMQELHVFITNAVVKILRAQLAHAEQSAKSGKFSQEHVVKNATFLVENLLPLVKDKYQDKTNQQLPNTSDFALTLTKIKRASKETLGEFV